MLGKILSANGNYFLEQSYQVNLSNGEEVFSLRCGLKFLNVIATRFSLLHWMVSWSGSKALTSTFSETETSYDTEQDLNLY